LIEVACRVFLLRQRGYEAAQDVIRQLEKRLSAKRD